MKSVPINIGQALRQTMRHYALLWKTGPEEDDQNPVCEHYLAMAKHYRDAANHHQRRRTNGLIHH